MIKLRSIFFVFLRLGALTFGGGLAMLPIIKRDIVDRGWIPEEDFSDYIAVAQVAPGMIAINIATLVGMHLRKRIGALVAVIGVALPSIVVITIIASLLKLMLISESPKFFNLSGRFCNARKPKKGSTKKR